LLLRNFSHDDIDGATTGTQGAVQFTGLGSGSGLAVKLSQFFEIHVPGIIAGRLNQLAVGFCEKIKEFISVEALDRAIRGLRIE
jgi:hypothetical protein